MKWIALAIAVLLSSCDQPSGPQKVQPHSSVHYWEIEIDGCAYLVTHVYMGDTLAHKGNCPNPIHK